jgi:DNA-binding MarR family transcriptional regulator
MVIGGADGFMSSVIQANPPSGANPATPEAVTALRAHPGFAQAMRTSATGIVALYEGSHLLNWLMDDRGRLLFGYLALYLHVTRDPADLSSGLTPTRMKALCAELEVCSPGRVTAMLSLMRFAGYLAPDTGVSDRRLRPLVATHKLTMLIEQRLRLHFAAMAPLLADGERLAQSLDDPAFIGRLVIAMAKRFRSGFRFVTHAPDLGLFGERNAGMLILASLLTAGEAGDSMPPQRAVPISISALARRFKVSRPHVLKLMRDAATDGLIERTGQDGDRAIIRPRLAEAAQNFFATMYLFFADCAREAIRSC